MPARNDFRTEGLNELIKAFADLPVQAEKNLIPAVDKAGEILLNNTRQEASIFNKYSHTGNLVKSLYIKQATLRNHKYTPVLTWHDDVRPYAAPLELGHRLVFFGHETNVKLPAHPFLRPGADKSKDEMFKIIKEAMGKTLDEMGGLRNGQH